MKKLFKRISAVCVAAVMMTTLLCTYAFAANGTVTATKSGSDGNVTIRFSYSVYDSWTEAIGKNKIKGFIIGSSDGSMDPHSYTVSFSPVSGTSTCVEIYNWNVPSDKASVLIPQATSGGMPDSFSTHVQLKPGIYVVRFKSQSSVQANGTFTIKNVYLPIYN